MHGLIAGSDIRAKASVEAFRPITTTFSPTSFEGTFLREWMVVMVEAPSIDKHIARAVHREFTF